MKVLAIERDVPGVRDENCLPYLKDEASKAWELYRAGTIRELYFGRDRDAAVSVLECADVAEARRILGELPLIRGRIAAAGGID